jgi:hypothetical protein
MRLGFTVDAKGNVPVKCVARTFASGNNETNNVNELIANYSK